MTSRMYPTAMAAFLTGEINLIGDTINAVLTSSGIDAYSDSHEFLSSIDGYPGVPAVQVDITAVTGGVVLADPTRWLDIESDGENTVDAVVLYKLGAGASSSPLVCYVDLAPFTPTGGDVLVTWDGTDGVFKLTSA